MFNFTTLTVYNTIVDATNVEKGTRVSKDANLIITKAGDGQLFPELRIGNTRFNAKNVLDVLMKKFTPESLAYVEFDFADLKSVVTADSQDTFKGSYRIALYISLVMNNHDALYANDLVYSGKPLYIEFTVNSEEEAASVTIARILKIAKKYMLLMYGEQILDFSEDDGKLVIKATNGYQVIKKAEILKYDPAANLIDCCSNNGDFVTKVMGIPCVFTLDETTGEVVPGEQYMDEDGTLLDYPDDGTIVPIVPGAEAFCDYNWIIHNLRLPTSANTDFWAPTRLEMPVVGGHYYLFIVRLWARRDGIGGEVVGQRATSVTTHVFYVLDDGNQGITGTGNVKKVYDALTNLIANKTENNTILTDADNVLFEPYKSVEEEESGQGGNG